MLVSEMNKTFLIFHNGWGWKKSWKLRPAWYHGALVLPFLSSQKVVNGNMKQKQKEKKSIKQMSAMKSERVIKIYLYYLFYHKRSINF